jgi:hypothetical protein
MHKGIVVFNWLVLCTGVVSARQKAAKYVDQVTYILACILFGFCSEEMAHRDNPESRTNSPFSLVAAIHFLYDLLFSQMELKA